VTVALFGGWAYARQRGATSDQPPAEWSRWNVGLRLAVAPAWPAEQVGVGQPATRRMQVAEQPAAEASPDLEEAKSRTPPGR
jgi:hypothetical protein